MFQSIHLSRFLSAFARWVWWSVLGVGLALCLASLTLHGWIVPRIDEWRAPLEQAASERLGTPVKIAALRAHSSSFLPWFELVDVKVLDATQRPVLNIDTVMLTLSPRSLLSLTFEEVAIERPVLDIHVDRAGKVRVAGIDFSKPGATDASALDWLFSLNHLRLNQGVIRWSDERLGNNGAAVPSVELTQVGLSIRNPLYRHLIRLDATPPTGWGQAFSLTGQFTQSLIHPDRGQFNQWNGQVFADLPHLDLGKLQQHVKMQSQLKAGKGAARVWVELKKGQIDEIHSDLALNKVHFHWAGAATPLTLANLSGHFDGKFTPSGFDLSTNKLQFSTASGLVWPGGNVELSWRHATEKKPESGQIKVDELDLAVVRQLATSLPLDASYVQWLQSVAPEGLVKVGQAKWQGAIGHLSDLQASGRVERLTLVSAPAPDKTSTGRPGLSAATVDFDLTHNSGSARVLINQGSVTLPGVWEDPLVAINRLEADLSWRISPGTQGPKIRLEINNGMLDSHDADGRFNATWETSDPQRSSSGSRFPGVIHLQGKLARADGARVWRYLPLVVSQSARDYVKMAIKEGIASDVRFTVKGDLHDMPFADPALGQFLVESKVDNTVLAYVPPSLQEPGEAPWPEFTQLSGDLIFSGQSMEVRNAKASIRGLPGLKIAKATVKIADLEYPVVKVQAQALGPLDEMLTLVNQSPLKTLSSDALAQATATGTGDYQLSLTLPVDHLQDSQVEGAVKLAGNTLQISPSTPVLARASGQVLFSHHGFQIKGAKATMLGGEVEFEGGSTSLGITGRPRLVTEAQRLSEPTVSIKGSGVATASGLQQATELGFVPRFAQFATGSTPYTVQLDVRHGRPEFLVYSSLEGLALHLPPPFYKPAETALPFVFDNHLIPGSDLKKAPVQDVLSVELGNLIYANYFRRIDTVVPSVLRGEIRVGTPTGEYLPQPETGVGASLNFPGLNIDAWNQLLLAISPTGGASPQLSTAGPTLSSAGSNPTTDYLPRIATVTADDITWNGRIFDQVAITMVRDGSTWRANVNTQQLAGYVEYEQNATAPQLFARLSRARLGAAQQAEVEQVLDDATLVLPALDLEIESFALEGKSLGAVKVQAVNRSNAQGGREWRLNQLQLTQPFAKLTATGTWSDSPTVNLNSAPVNLGKRRMLLNFLLDIDNAGDLLTWSGNPKTIRGGKGKLEGTVAWRGSPFAVHYPSMAGQMALSVKNGQFLKIDSDAANAAKLLGLLSLQSLPRRLTLDFTDIFSDGFGFDTITGDLSVDQGVANTSNLQMKGPNALIFLEGNTDLVKETQNMRVVVAPEINAVGASLAYVAVNPALGFGSLIAQLFLAKPIAKATTREYVLAGTWDEPEFTQVKRDPNAKVPSQPAASPSADSSVSLKP